MARAKKTPSGMWKVRVYSHTDKEGKKHYKAFTAPSKAEAEAMAADFAGQVDRATHQDLTVGEAIDRYIRAKAGVLSPKTIREYKGMAGRYYDDIGRYRIRKLTSEQLQIWISDLAETVSAKTVRNAYGLLISAIGLYLPDRSYRVTLPARPKKRTTAPSDDQIRVLYDLAQDWLRICIALAAFGSLRRGEICALTYGDIDGCVVHVTKDIVQDADSQWVVKDMPKTSDSIRDVVVPAEVTALIGSGPADARIIDKNPNSLTLAFIRIRNRLGLVIRFHDLRHYFASIGAVLGVPDIYLAQFGGWHAGSGVLKEVYQHQIDGAADRYAGTMTDHFAGLIKTI